MNARARKKVMVYVPGEKCQELVYTALEGRFQAGFDVLLGRERLGEAKLVISVGPPPPWVSEVPVIQIEPAEVTNGAPLLDWLENGGKKAFWIKIERLYQHKLLEQALEEQNKDVFFSLLGEIADPIVSDQWISQAAKAWKVRRASLRQALEKAKKDQVRENEPLRLQPGFNYIDGTTYLPVVIGGKLAVVTYDLINLERILPADEVMIEPPLDPRLVTKLEVPPWDVEAWAQGEIRADWGEIWGALEKQLNYYIEFLEPHHIHIVTAWVMATFFYGALPHFPYLYLGGEPGSGKSKTLDFIRHTAFQPTFIAAPTVAAVFRLIDCIRGTVLIDEAEALGAEFAQGLVTILNVGFDAGRGIIPRAEKNQRDRFDLKAFRVYGPKAIASVSGLVGQALRALRSRVIEITLVQAGGPQGQRDVEDNDLFQAIRTRLYALGLSRWNEFKEVYASERQQLPNRVSAKWAPLLAVARLAAPEEAYEALWAEAVKESQAPLDPLIIPILEALEVLLQQCGTDEVEARSRDIANLIGESEDVTGRLTRRIARRLSNLGFTHKTVKGSRRFIITKNHLNKLKERFAVHSLTPQTKPPKPPHNNKSASEANLSGVAYTEGKATPDPPQTDKQPRQGGLTKEGGLGVAYKKQKSTPPKQATQADSEGEGGLGGLDSGYIDIEKNLGRSPGPGVRREGSQPSSFSSPSLEENSKGQPHREEDGPTPPRPPTKGKEAESPFPSRLEELAAEDHEARLLEEMERTEAIQEETQAREEEALTW